MITTENYAMLVENTKMSMKEKIICVIEFSGNKYDWDCWLEKFLAKELLLGKKNKVGYDKVPTASKINVVESKYEPII